MIHVPAPTRSVAHRLRARKLANSSLVPFIILCIGLLLWSPGSAQAAPSAETEQVNGTLFPVAIFDFVTTNEDTSVLIDVLANDRMDERPSDSTPPSRSLLLLTGASGNLSGSSAEVEDGKIRYVPRSNFTGLDIFRYVVVANDNNFFNRSIGFIVVRVVPVADGPTDIGISTTTIPEGTRGLVATFNVVDPNGSGPHVFSLGSRQSHPDNDFFVIVGNQLGLGPAADFERKSSYTIGVEVSNRSGGAFAKEFILNVLDGNDPPTRVRLSNTRIDENQPAGTLVGRLSSDDIDSSSHTYELIQAGIFGADSNRFTVVGSELRTAEVLDFEEKTSYRVIVKSTDDAGGSANGLMRIRLNNLPSPPDEVQNGLSFCSGDAITLIERNSSRSNERVRVTIDNVTVSQKTSRSCQVEGTMSILTNGQTVNGLAFSGRVNSRNQFSDASMTNFSVGVAGITLEARDVEVQYTDEQPSLHITRPQLRMPREFGGLTASLAVPSVIDADGVRFGTGSIDLPTISTKSGFELDLSGELQPVADGFEIVADGTIGLPNIGKSKSSGSRGRTCSINAGVTIFANDKAQTVMRITSGSTMVQAHTSPHIENAGFFASANAMSAAQSTSPEAAEDFGLNAVRAGASCDPGLAIGTTGLFLTSINGEVTVEPGEEQVDVEVTIEAGKSVPGLGPIVALDGGMSLRPRPFKLDVGAALSVLSFEVADADATLTTRKFRTSVRVTGLFYTTSAKVQIRTRSGRVIFTGSGRAAIEVVKGSLGEKCFIFCVDVPPFGIGPLASVRVDVGEFRTGDFGFKGVVKVLGISTGFFVDASGRLKFGDVSRFRLVRAQQVAAAKAIQGAALENGDTGETSAVSASDVAAHEAALRDFVFLENEQGESEGVIIRAPLEKATASAEEIRASDVITQINLIRHGDVVFDLMATGPIDLTLISPEGKEITPANYSDEATLGYTVAYTQSVAFEMVRNSLEDGNSPDASIPNQESQAANGEGLPRLHFIPLATAPALNGIDLRIDGLNFYENLTWQNSAQIESLALNAGQHTVELLTHGTETVLLSTTIDMEAGHNYTLISGIGNASVLKTIEDDLGPPENFGMSKIRFFNGSSTSIDMRINGSSVFPWTSSATATGYVDVNAGAYTVEFYKQSDGQLAAASIPVDLAEGGVYTFFTTDYTEAGYSAAAVQRTDMLYTTAYQTSYSIDQAEMGQNWQMKLVGDTDNIPYQVSIWGPSNPPILGSVSYDASDLAATRVSWQLTSDVRPTKVTVFATTEEISAQLPITETDGGSSGMTTIFEGIPVAEFEISDMNELGGQLVTKIVDLSGLASGTWHLWIRADDGVNPSVSVYASAPSVVAAGTQSVYGSNAVRLAKDDFDLDAMLADATPLVIDRTGDFPTEWTAEISPTFDPATNSLYVEWRINSHPDTDNYRLLWGDTPLSPTQVITAGGSISEFDENGVATGVEVGFATLHDIRPDVPYFISVEAVDSETGNSVRSQEVEFKATSPAFALTTSLPNVNVKAGDSVKVPVTLSAEEALFFNNVWLSTDLGGTPPGVTAQYVDDSDGFNELNAETPTLELEISVDASVPEGTYPVNIAGYNGDKKEEMIFNLVIGDSGQSAGTQIFLPQVMK